MTGGLGQVLAGLLDRSDERDLYEIRVRQAFKEGYDVGRKGGYEAGYGQAVSDWKVTAGGMTDLGGPDYAEQDRRRYPPHGRLSWITRPRKGERCVHEAASVPCPDDCQGWEGAA